MKVTDTFGDAAGGRRTRRDVLASLGAGGAIGLAGCLGDDDGDGETDGETTETADDETAKIGASIPQSGLWSNEGEQLLNGYTLAAQHINAAEGAVTAGPWDALAEEPGVLGRDVELVVEDTRSSADGAQESAQALVDEGVEMFAGGGSAAEGVAHQEVASEAETVYMGGFTPTGAVTGTNCSTYGFNEIYNPPMVAEALASVLAEALGTEDDVNFAQLYPDTDVGEELSLAFRSRFEEIGDGWFHQYRDSTREGVQNFTSQVEELLTRGPDMVILNYYGFEADRAIRELFEQAETDIQVVVPILNWVFAQSAGSALEGVYGTVHWDPSLQDSFSSRLVESWSEIDADTVTPPPMAHLAYVQLCQYADAVERAGTFDWGTVVPRLSGHSYDVGMGEQTLRDCDHQSMRNVLVARGLPESLHSGDNYYELVDTWEGEAYSCDQQPAANCTMEL